MSYDENNEVKQRSPILSMNRRRLSHVTQICTPKVANSAFGELWTKT